MTAFTVGNFGINALQQLSQFLCTQRRRIFEHSSCKEVNMEWRFHIQLFPANLLAWYWRI